MTDWREDGLSQTQGLELIWEMDSARYLMRAAVKLIRTTKSIDLNIHPILTLASIGVEKLLKLALGLREVSLTRQWPSKQTMRTEYGHGSSGMYQTLLQTLNGDIDKQAHPGTPLRTALDSAASDPLWPSLLDLLTRYGSRARFYHLDALAEEPQQGDGPEQSWDLMEGVACDAYPDLAELRMRAISEPFLQDDLDRFQAEFQAKVADSLEHFWSLMVNLGIFGLLGERGKVYGFEIRQDVVFMEMENGNL